MNIFGKKRGYVNIWVIIGIIALLLFAGVYLIIDFQERAKIESISSFEECRDAGYPIMESYPEQCATPDGRVFVNTSQSVGLRICPEAWYENRMPGPDSGEGFEQYFVINGERVEVYEVDVPWVRENCEVNSPQPVY